MEITEYKNKKIVDLRRVYNSKILSERQKHSRDLVNIRRNFLISLFQKSNLTRQLTSELSNRVFSINKEMEDSINKIKNIYPNKIKVGKKKALLIGINYEKTSAQLNGCINDVSLIGNYLKTKQFLDISLLTDKTENKPTKNNILLELEKFLSTSEQDDILYFHYSGHGSYIKDLNGDETDGKDETIVSKDFLNITDDELINIIRNKLPKDRTLIAVFDSCHSGTILDLKYSFTETIEKISINESTKYEDLSPNLILLSGCRDSQYSMETLTSTGVNGLLTWAIYDTLTKVKDLTWKSFYLSVRKLLRDIRAVQVPQLSMGSLIDINDKAVF
jgi:hypothetical protein